MGRVAGSAIGPACFEKKKRSHQNALPPGVRPRSCTRPRVHLLRRATSMAFQHLYSVVELKCGAEGLSHAPRRCRSSVYDRRVVLCGTVTGPRRAGMSPPSFAVTAGFKPPRSIAAGRSSPQALLSFTAVVTAPSTAVVRPEPAADDASVLPARFPTSRTRSGSLGAGSVPPSSVPSPSVGSAKVQQTTSSDGDGDGDGASPVGTFVVCPHPNVVNVDVVQQQIKMPIHWVCAGAGPARVLCRAQRSRAAHRCACCSTRTHCFVLLLHVRASCVIHGAAVD